MKTYHGLAGGRVSAVVDGESYPLDPRVDLLSFYDLINPDEPNRFSWGTPPDGPLRTFLDGDSQLALAILADYTADDAFAILHATEFSRLVITNLPPRVSFIVDGAEVGSFVSRVSPGAPNPEGDTP